LSVLEHSIVLCPGDTIEIGDLPDYLWRPAPSQASTSTDSLDELERVHIELVMRTASSIREAAERLGIDQATLWRRRKRYGLLGQRN
jgi:NtrC-family two-component system response regulator AlgB